MLKPEDTGATSAETQNADSSAETQNTDSGQAPNPPSRERDQFVSLGIKLERERLMKKFGVESYDEIAEALETHRTVQTNTGPPATTDDISSHPEFEKLTRELGQYQRKSTEYERSIKQLKAQADEARLEKLRSAALERGVGPGTQLTAFIKLYGDRVRFGDDQQLEVLGKLTDGTKVPLGESLDDFIANALDESRFLVAPEGRTGAGSRQEPATTQSTNTGEYDPKSNYAAFGISDGKRSSKIDRFYNRLVPKDDS